MARRPTEEYIRAARRVILLAKEDRALPPERQRTADQRMQQALEEAGRGELNDSGYRTAR